MSEANSKALKEQRGVIGSEIKKLSDLVADEKRDFSAEENERWEKMNRDFDDLCAKVKTAERRERAEMVSQESLVREERSYTSADKAIKTRQKDLHNLSLRGWLKIQKGLSPHAEELDAMQRFGIGQNQQQLEIKLPGEWTRSKRGRNKYKDIGTKEQRSLSIFSGTGGGYTIPEGFVNALEVALLWYGGMRERCQIMRTPSGQDLPYPTTNDTSNKAVIINENSQTQQQDVIFNQIILRAYKLYSKLVLVPNELLEDSAFDVGAMLGNLLGIRLARGMNQYLTNGTGNTQPNGLQNAVPVGATAASSSAIAADDVKNLVQSVDPEYRKGAIFMAHDTILWALRKLKDTQGRYLMGWDFSAPDGNQVIGYDFQINQDLPSVMASGNHILYFGQFQKYLVREIGSVRLARLDQRYADFDQTGFVAFYRFDGNLLDAGTHPIKCLSN